MGSAAIVRQPLVLLQKSFPLVSAGSGRLEDLQDLDTCQGGRVNPMFAIFSWSTEDLAVHYGSDPLLGFHLATAFDGRTASSLEHADVIAVVAKSQFRAWCEALGSQINLGKSRSKFSGETLYVSAMSCKPYAILEGSQRAARSSPPPYAP